MPCRTIFTSPPKPTAACSEQAANNPTDTAAVRSDPDQCFAMRCSCLRRWRKSQLGAAHTRKPLVVSATDSYDNLPPCSRIRRPPHSPRDTPARTRHTPTPAHTANRSRTNPHN